MDILFQSNSHVIWNNYSRVIILGQYSSFGMEDVHMSVKTDRTVAE